MAFTSTKKRAIDLAVPGVGLGFTAYFLIYKQKDRDIRYVLFVMAVIGIGLYFLTSSITNIALQNALSGLKPKDQEKVMKDYSITDTDYSRLQQIAKDIYAAFHDSWWTEDEDKAINALNGCTTPNEVKSVSTIYAKLYGVGLKSEFDNYVTFMDLFANPLKEIVISNWS